MSDPVPRLRRILTLIPLLRQNPGITITRLCQMLNVSRKEVKRDLDRISLCGVPPYLPHDYISVLFEGERVYIDYADHFERPVQLTLPEAIALKFALESLPTSGELEAAAAALLRQVEGLLRASGEALAKEPRSGGSVSEGTLARFRRLREAIARRERVDFTYYSRTSEDIRERSVSPYGLVDNGGNLYLIGFCHWREAIRGFRLDRMQSPRWSEDPFAPEPEGFDLQEHAARGLAPRDAFLVRVRFAASIARFVREEYEGAPILELPGGDLVVDLRAGSVPWVVGHVLGYGELAEVLEPEEVRADLTSRLRPWAPSAAEEAKATPVRSARRRAPQAADPTE